MGEDQKEYGLQTIPEAKVINFEEYAMNLETVVRQVTLIQQVMEKTMREGEHYGAAFEGAKKPSLLKPGAEKISTVFRLAPKYEINKSDLPNGHREYELICSLIHIPTGQFVGQGVGSCSSMESKYRFRDASRKCPKCGKETIIKGKAEYGGGWLCFAKKGGCGEKWKDGDQAIADQEIGRIEHDNPADYFNTILKMGKKRAHVDAILTATATSDIFTQDIEDMSQPTTEPIKKKPESPEKKKPGRPKKESDVTDEPLTEAQNKKLRTMIGNIEGLNSEEKTDFLQWLKKQKANTITIGDKTVITKKSISDIFDNFDNYFSEFSVGIMGVVDPPQEQEDIPLFEEGE